MIWDDELGPIPHHETSSALQFNKDLSTSWREHLEQHSIGPAGVLGCRKSPYTLVGELSVLAAREMRFAVTHSPTETIPIGCAHASVSWPIEEIRPPAKQPDKRARARLRSQIARGFPIIYGEVTSARPPGS